MSSKTMVSLTWVILALVLALRLGYGQAAISLLSPPAPLAWTITGVEELGQELESVNGVARTTADRFVLIQIQVVNGNDTAMEFPGFNLLSRDRGTIYPHLGNLAMAGGCTPGVIGPGETLKCGYVFELGESIERGVVVMDGNGEAGVVIP